MVRSVQHSTNKHSSSQSSISEADLSADSLTDADCTYMMNNEVELEDKMFFFGKLSFPFLWKPLSACDWYLLCLVRMIGRRLFAPELLLALSASRNVVTLCVTLLNTQICHTSFHAFTGCELTSSYRDHVCPTGLEDLLDRSSEANDSDIDLQKTSSKLYLRTVCLSYSRCSNVLKNLIWILMLVGLKSLFS